MAPVSPRYQVLEDGSLLLEWSDGHQTALSAEFLRAACPCAACRDLPEGFAPPPGRIVRCHPVGRYALQLIWDDGHGTGIYPFRFLRDSCGCLHCRTTSASSPSGSSQTEEKQPAPKEESS